MNHKKVKIIRQTRRQRHLTTAFSQKKSQKTHIRNEALAVKKLFS